MTRQVLDQKADLSSLASCTPPALTSQRFEIDKKHRRKKKTNGQEEQTTLKVAIPQNATKHLLRFCYQATGRRRRDVIYLF